MPEKQGNEPEAGFVFWVPKGQNLRSLVFLGLPREHNLRDRQRNLGWASGVAFWYPVPLSRRSCTMSSFESSCSLTSNTAWPMTSTRRTFIPGGRDNLHLNYSRQRKPPFQCYGAIPRRG